MLKVRAHTHQYWGQNNKWVRNEGGRWIDRLKSKEVNIKTGSVAKSEKRIKTPEIHKYQEVRPR